MHPKHAPSHLPCTHISSVIIAAHYTIQAFYSIIVVILSTIRTALIAHPGRRSDDVFDLMVFGTMFVLLNWCKLYCDDSGRRYGLKLRLQA